MSAYYNEIDPPAVAILRQLIAEGVIAPGEVDTRSIKEVQPNDLRGFTQVHLFAGGGLWSVAARLAGWPDWAPIWTGSCPCQPFSAAGKGGGTDDPRHLWPDFLRLIRACRDAGHGPPVIMGEQVSGAAGYGWFDGVRADLASEGYASRARDFPACSVDAPHQRNRLYWIAVADDEIRQRGARLCETGSEQDRDIVANSDGDGRTGVTLGDAFGSGLEGQRRDGDGSRGQEQGRPVAKADVSERQHLANDPIEPFVSGRPGEARSAQRAHDRKAWPVSGGEPADPHGRRIDRRNGTYWSDADWIICHDGKARRAQPGLRLLVNGLPGRVDLWRVGGNAIVPIAAAEVIAAFMDVYGLPQPLARAA